MSDTLKTRLYLTLSQSPLEPLRDETKTAARRLTFSRIITDNYLRPRPSLSTLCCVRRSKIKSRDEEQTTTGCNETG